MPRKLKQSNDQWIVETSIAKKAKEYFLTGLQNFSTLLVEGSSGTGKSMWIQFGQSELDLAPIHKVSVANTSLENILTQSLDKTLVLYNWSHSRLAEKNYSSLTQYLQNRKYELNRNHKIVLEISLEEKKQLLQEEKGKSLYQEVSLMKVLIPDLRDRKQEIPLFIFHFAKDYCDKFSRKVPDWEPEVLEKLQSRPYPNNLQELRDVIFSCLAFSKKNKIKWKDIPSHIWKTQSNSIELPPGYDWDFYEKEIIKTNLLYCRGNREKTAQLLNISVRNLYRKIEAYGIDVDSLTS